MVQAFEQSHCHLHLFRMYGQNWDWQATITEHEEIVAAIDAADSQRAEEAMTKHLHQAYLRFYNALTEGTDDLEGDLPIKRPAKVKVS